MLLHDPTSKTNPKLVRIHSASIWCWDKPRATLDSLDSPRPGLGGSHHLPPYSILCVAPPHPHPNGCLSRDPWSGVPKLSRFGLPGLWAIITSRPDLWSDKLWTNLVALLKSFSTPCCTLPTHVGIGSILDFLWSRVKLPVWLPALLLPITWAADVQMTHARPSWTSTLQDLFNDSKNTSMQGVLTPAIKLWVFGSPGGLQVPTFGTVSFILTLSPKWGCDKEGECEDSWKGATNSKRLLLLEPLG
jgi:hypothetical protein